MIWKVLILFFVAKISFSQDVHFSQNFVDRINFNPSLVGDLSENDFRVSIIRKSQWQSVSVPYSTLSSSFEGNEIYKKFNFGLQFLNDKSGSSKLTHNQFNIAISRKFNVNRHNSFSLGLFTGVGQKTIDYSELLFEEEEYFITDNLMFADIGFGTNYSTNIQEKLSYNLGFSIYHINNPSISFLEDKTVILPIKNNYNIGVNYRFNSKTNLKSEIIISKQITQKEILIGIRPSFDFEEFIVFPIAFYRVNDAAIFGFGMQKNNFFGNISYDINISDLQNASNNKSGFEFSLIYKWKKKKKKKKIKDIKEKCPEYL